MKYISLIVTSTRIAPLNIYLNYNYFLIIYILIIILIFIYALLIALTLQINKISSKFYQLNISVIRYTSRIIIHVLFIPISEFTMSMLKCNNGFIFYFTGGVACWKGLHLLYCFMSVVFTIAFYIIIVFMIIFYFEPFNSKKSTLR